MHSSSADATVLSPLPYYLLATTMCGSCARAFLERFRCVRSIAADGLAAAWRPGGRRPACRAGSLPTAREGRLAGRDRRTACVGAAAAAGAKGPPAGRCPRPASTPGPAPRATPGRPAARRRARACPEVQGLGAQAQRREVAAWPQLLGGPKSAGRGGSRAAPAGFVAPKQDRLSPRAERQRPSAPAATICAASRTEPFVLAALTIGWSTSAPVQATTARPAGPNSASMCGVYGTMSGTPGTNFPQLVPTSMSRAVLKRPVGLIRRSEGLADGDSRRCAGRCPTDGVRRALVLEYRPSNLDQSPNRAGP